MQNDIFSSTKSLAKIVVILLVVDIGIDIANILVNTIQLIAFPQMGTTEDLSSAELMLGLAALAVVALNIPVFIGTVVLFLMWLHRSYKNLFVFEVKSLEASPGWAVGYWFIPFLNLFKPLKIVNEVWHGSNSENLGNNFNYSDTSSPSLHIFWWIAWLSSNITANIGSRIVFSSTSSEVQNLGTVLVVIASALSGVAAFLLIKIVQNITERQEESGNKTQIQTPPMPPIFNQSNQAF